MLWSHRGELYVTAVVKATFSFPDGGTMRRLNPQPIRRNDDYLSGVPSLAGAAEVAPQTLSPEVVVVGHAYAERGETHKRSVRLTVVRGHKILIDKTLFVYGDRVRGGRPKPFKRMRIGYERALGGLTFPGNPIGIGRDDDSSRLPNIIDPSDPEAGVAGFGPFPARFPKRRRFIKRLPAGALDAVPIELPPDFDFRFFNAAPADQQLERLRGDEWIMVEGMHPMYARLRARLPRLQARCRVYAPPGAHAPDLIGLRADLLHIEPGEQRCSIVWRGHFPVESASLAQALVLVGAVQVGDEAIAWPATAAHLDPSLPALTPAGRGGHLEGTQASAGPPPSSPGMTADPGWRVAVEGEDEGPRPPKIGDTMQPPPLPPTSAPSQAPLPAPPSWPVAAGWGTAPNSAAVVPPPAPVPSPPPLAQPHPPTVQPATTPQGTPDFAQTIIHTESPSTVSPGTRPQGTPQVSPPTTVPYDFHATRFEHTEMIVDDDELEVLSGDDDDVDDLAETRERK